MAAGATRRVVHPAAVRGVRCVFAPGLQDVRQLPRQDLTGRQGKTQTGMRAPSVPPAPPRSREHDAVRSVSKFHTRNGIAELLWDRINALFSPLFVRHDS